MINKELELYILSTVFDSRGYITSYYCGQKYFKKRPDIKEYLELRYSDIPQDLFSYAEVIYRIKHNIEIRPVCPICGKYIKFNNAVKGYYFACKGKCVQLLESTLDKIKKTCLERYGVERVANSDIIKEKKKKTCLERYGVENPLQCETVKDKIKETCLKRYGTEYYNQTDEFKEKCKLTCLDRYGYEYHSLNPEVKKRKVESIRKTMLERYGVDFYTLASDFYDKYRKTCLERYGVEYAAQSIVFKNKVISTNLERYGVKYYIQTDDFKEKCKQTWLIKYGVDNPFKLKTVREKLLNTMLLRYGTKFAILNNLFKLKFISTCLLKYNAPSFMESDLFNIRLSEIYNIDNVHNAMDIPELVHKIHLTKKQKGSYSKSDEEDIIYNELCNYFGKENIIRLYKSEKYPFNCDFYITSNNLYIEYQGSWTHNDHAFDPLNENDILFLNKWKKKAEKSDYYKSAIHVWTESDPLKRYYAKLNNLNYIEIWSVDLITDILNNINK